MAYLIYNKQILRAETPCISPQDRGFTLGHGLFETLLFNENSFPAFDYHWQRLAASAPLLGIILPFSRFELETMLNELMKVNTLENQLAGARVTITHGDSARGLVPAEPTTPNFLITSFAHDWMANRPFSALIVNTRKNEHSLSARIKSISALDNILAKQEAKREGYDEAILLNSKNQVADGAMTNIYLVKDKQILTPPLEDGALPGVIRSILLQEFQHKLAISEQSISVAMVLAAKEVFLSNALLGVQPLRQINNTQKLDYSTAQHISNLLNKEKNYGFAL